MSFNADVTARLSRKQSLYESRREREFYRYFEPVRALSAAGPKLCDLHDESAVRAHQPVSSPDRALTAFCQLGALRLGTRRAMLFFFDTNFAYVLAEATRSLSLQDDSVHEIEDKLWLGHSIIPRGFSVCEETVCRAIPVDPSDKDYESSLIHIIRDLEKDTVFCDRPYVTDGPKARFYAGVPITTPKGINIGAYCCLDDKVRTDGITEKDKNFLKDMAATVMTHLETVRAKAEHERGSQMVTGLGAFVEGATNLHEWTEQSIDRNHRKPRVNPKRLSSMAPAPKRGFNFMRGSSASSTSGNHSLLSQSPTISEGTPITPTSHTSLDTVKTKNTTPNEDETMISISNLGLERINTTTISRHAEDLRTGPSGVGNTLERAIHIVREAMDVDGAQFLDANVGSYGALINRQNESGSDNASSSEAMASGNDYPGTETEGEYGEQHKSPGKSCCVLASSYSSTRQDENGVLQEQAPEISEKFLRSMLRRYPRGKIWNFNGDGDGSSDDESSEAAANEHVIPPRRSKEHTKRKKTRRQVRIEDCREIQRLFPRARSLALVGMWDQNRDRWFSACIIWTYKPLRLFSADLEVNYLAAFCDVIMAEIHRLEAQNSDKAKGDFISSISHELRSPLHGILGSVECLQDQPIDTQSANLIAQIDVCGRTLVDIVDHILEYTKINHHTKVAPPRSQSKIHRPFDNDKSACLGNMMSLDTVVSLDEITEEVIQTTTYSFAYSRSKELMLDRKVAVILDIEQPEDPTMWKCHAPLGGWKRIVINLLSNALKYTDEGYIKISLRACPIPGKRKKFNAVLTVKDSGRGMSREFLENHLFKAFSQEDTLMEGTGLGMSLVAKIVRALGGSIEVQSEKWAGTTITVVLPLDRQSRASNQVEDAVNKVAALKVSGTTIGLVNFHHPDSHSSRPPSPSNPNKDLVYHSLQRTCTRLGFQIIPVNDKTVESDYEVCVTTESEYPRYQQLIVSALQKNQGDNTAPGRMKPTIVLCDSTISERRLRNLRRDSPIYGHVEYIAQPCGPQRLVAAVRNCLTAGLKEFIDAGNGAVSMALHPGPKALISPPQENVTGTRESQLKASVEDSPLEENVTAVSNPLDSSNDRHDTLRSHSTGALPNSPMVLSPHPMPPNSPAATNTLSQTSVEPSADRLSLLLVDDNHINLQLLVNYAKKQKHPKLTASDGKEAIEVYKNAWLPHLQPNKGRRPSLPMNSHLQTATLQLKNDIPRPPQVILMDINMPVLNGFEATRAIRSFEKHHNLPPAHIIALTGLGGASAQQEAFKSGVDLFLTKPVRLKELTKLLEDIVNEEAHCH
ncbi:Hypothetical protein R9X50_00148300 [Acrodontium crateriforme]|uniref:histidine kinase n=1 Tax=Acrodontium crateriforme TaxID=150365 RepID=A0AAQ3LZE0_9PEZI|nr:Hypothetical protein R9X50_00148300 [Acrodontium crateriforme]